MELLKNISIEEKKYDIYKNILTSSKHSVNDEKIKHLANWIELSSDLHNVKNFIIENINNPNFHPFADPWVENFENIYKKNDNKILRLSTRIPAVLTLSVKSYKIIHYRIPIKDGKIIFKNYSFKTIKELFNHLDLGECCICLSELSKENHTILSCGHILHSNCLNKLLDGNCPICKKRYEKYIEMDEGNSCLYSSHF